MFKHRVPLSAAELRELYVTQGKTMTEIAAQFGVGESSVRRELHKQGIVSRPRGPKGSKESAHLTLTADTLRELYVECQRSIPQIAELYGCANETIRQRLLKHDIPIRSFSRAHLVQHGTYNEYRDFDGDDCEKAYLLGFRLGDLHVRREKAASEVISISCGSSKYEQIELIQQLFAPFGHLTFSRHVRLNFNGLLYHFVRCSLNESFEFLLNYSSELPGWILDRDDVFVAFFGGFTDAEGSFQIRKTGGNTPGGRYSLKNTDKRILEQCREKLLSMRVQCTGLQLAYKGGWTSKRGVHANKDLWSFNIEQKESLLKFIALISPYIRHAKRRADMERVRQNVEWRSSEEFQQEANRKRVESNRKTLEAKKKNKIDNSG